MNVTVNEYACTQFIPSLYRLTNRISPSCVN